MQSIEQRLQIRARLASHRLPCGPADHVFGSLGTQALCNCCDERIDSDEIEFELQFESAAGVDHRLTMHSPVERRTRSTQTSNAAS